MGCFMWRYRALRVIELMDLWSLELMELMGLWSLWSLWAYGLMEFIGLIKLIFKETTKPSSSSTASAFFTILPFYL